MNKRIRILRAIPGMFLILFTSTLWFSTHADIPKGEVLFQDNFSEGTGKWIDGDRGNVREGWYHLRGKQGVLHRVALKGSGKWTDYIVEFDLKIVNVIASWMVRCELDPTPGHHYLFCFNGREFQRNIMLDKNRPAGELIVRNPIRHGESHRVTILVRGDTVKHYIDGELIDTLTDASLGEGGFGFRQMNAEEGAFANVKVYALPPEISGMQPFNAATAFHPLASIPFVSKPPDFDGVVKEDEWADAAEPPTKPHHQARYCARIRWGDLLAHHDVHRVRR